MPSNTSNNTLDKLTKELEIPSSLSDVTDEEIVKALECCIEAMDSHNCGDCPPLKKECIVGLPKLALGLIKRLQAK